MGDRISRQARRRFLRVATASVAAVPFCGVRLYKHDAPDVDPNEWPDYEQGEICANCQLYHGEQGAEWGPCDIFALRLVSANGWCVTWLQKEA